MVTFHPPHNSLRHLGQADAVPVGAPLVSTRSLDPVLAPAPVVVTGPDYDAAVPVSMAGLVVGGVVLLGLGLSVLSALKRR